MKVVSKIWKYLTMFFAGVISGIVLYIKYLDKPEQQINFDKVKIKDSNQNTVSIPVQQQKEEVKKKKIRLFKRKMK